MTRTVAVSDVCTNLSQLSRARTPRSGRVGNPYILRTSIEVQYVLTKAFVSSEANVKISFKVLEYTHKKSYGSTATSAVASTDPKDEQR